VIGRFDSRLPWVADPGPVVLFALVSRNTRLTSSVCSNLGTWDGHRLLAVLRHQPRPHGVESRHNARPAQNGDVLRLWLALYDPSGNAPLGGVESLPDALTLDVRRWTFPSLLWNVFCFWKF